MDILKHYILEESEVLRVLQTDVKSIADKLSKGKYLVQWITDKHLDLVKDSRKAKDIMKVLVDIFEQKRVNCIF